MPNQPQASRGSQQSAGKGKSAGGAKMPPKAMSAAAERPARGTPDEVYGVVSVLYHALQGSETYEQYVEDARSAGDDELVSFFEQCREEEKDRAERAKALLAARLDKSADEDEDDEDEDEEDEDDEDEDDEE